MIPSFIMMVGIPGSGKSTVAAKLAAKIKADIISSDSIRGEIYGDETIQGSHDFVFQLMEERTMTALAAERNVIYDATNVTVARREEFLKKLPKIVNKICIWVNTPKERALQNNRERERHVPEWVIHQMANNLVIPTKSEGWDDIYVVTY